MILSAAFVLKCEGLTVLDLSRFKLWKGEFDEISTRDPIVKKVHCSVCRHPGNQLLI